ncbi:MAG: hypothetical protein JO060_06085, partial [Candidatus Eremiobacteraeota bacterium]|nr:hypothetical protein [Candidatus Eremiobacteraeota bacterium]
MHLRLLAAVALLVAAFACPRAALAQQPAQLDRPLATAQNPMTVLLDARKAPVGLAYTHMTIPAAPGRFTIDYPEWIPGEHSPTGPLSVMSQLRVSAGGRPLHWQRDPVDLYAFHVTVPPGVHTINADYTVILNTDAGGTLASRNI